MLPLERKEVHSYLALLVAVAALIGLLRSDLGKYLVDEDRLFYKLPNSVPAPRLRLRLARLGNEPVLRLDTENFRFANYCSPPEAGQPLLGHAHLYLDGRKHASVYEPVIFLRRLPHGDHKVTVSLNVLPDHRAIMVDGVPVMREIRIRVPNGELLGASPELATAEPSARSPE